jgi:hypothetical protein
MCYTQRELGDGVAAHVVWSASEFAAKAMDGV